MRAAHVCPADSEGGLHLPVPCLLAGAMGAAGRTQRGARRSRTIVTRASAGRSPPHHRRRGHHRNAPTASSPACAPQVDLDQRGCFAPPYPSLPLAFSRPESGHGTLRLEDDRRNCRGLSVVSHGPLLSGMRKRILAKVRQAWTSPNGLWPARHAADQASDLRRAILSLGSCNAWGGVMGSI